MPMDGSCECLREPGAFEGDDAFAARSRRHRCRRQLRGRERCRCHPAERAVRMVMVYRCRQSLYMTRASRTVSKTSRLKSSSRARAVKLSTEGFCHGLPGSMNDVPTPEKLHQSRTAAAIELGTVVATQELRRAVFGDGAVEDVGDVVGRDRPSQVPPTDTRVCSSQALSALMGLPSLVASKRKSNAHT